MSTDTTKRAMSSYILATLILQLMSVTYVHSSVECGEMVNNIRNCSVRIQEQVPDGTLVFDSQSYLNSEIIFHTPTGTNSNFYDANFEVVDKMLLTEGSFDRETMVTRATSPYPVVFVVDIIGYHNTDNQQRITLTVFVIDLNDNIPRFKKGLNFLQSTHQLMVFESPNIDRIFTVEAVDYDEGINGTSHVEIVQQLDLAMFNISVIYEGSHPSTIYVEPVSALDREVRDSYFFQLIAYEGTENPTNATLNVTLTIQDINDNLPNFNQSEYSSSISEQSPVNTSLIQVHAYDPDIGTNAAIHYSIKDVCAKTTVSGSCSDISKPWPFVLDTESGFLQIREMLNYEEKVEYRLTIDASNPNEPLGGSSTALVNVEVLDINDNAPEVVDFFAASSLSESSLVNSTYATFGVQDADSQKFSKFHLYLLDNATLDNSTIFGLQSSSQIFSVVLLKLIDREVRDQYDLILMAKDVLNSSLFTTHNFTVFISDINDHSPVFDTVTNPLVLEEESSIDTLVVQVSATDEDTGTNAAIRYSLPAKSIDWPYQGNFSIQPITGKILVSVLLDRETTPTLSILVQAIDQNGAGRITNHTLNISLQDINDNSPVITTNIPAAFNVKENVSLNTLVVDIDATDADVGPNAQVTFSLTLLSPEINNPPFNIDSSNGRITINSTLDRETVPQYSVILSVTDGVNTPTQRNFTLNIQDINDNSPTFSNNNYYRTLHENVTVDSQVISLVASDLDSAQFTNLTYSFVEGSSHFHLNSASGVITTASTLDWETQSLYTLIVRAFDGFGRHSQTDATLIVTVVDVNDEIPRFIGAPYVFSVDEGTGTGAYVGQIMVQSVEQGHNGAPLFFIDTNNVPFEINETGAILTTANLNREDVPEYEVTVRVEDVAPPPHYNTTVVTVIVSDINDHPPRFSNEVVQISLSEIETVNSPFYIAHANDEDISPNNVTKYYLHQDTEGFQINPDTGELSLTTSLNYEAQLSVLVTVIARDNGNPLIYYDTLQVNITVLDDNNTNITFPSSFPLLYHLQEDASLNYVLLNFTGEDHKGNPRLHLNYYLTNESGVVPLEFGIERESSSGYALLTVAAELDREMAATYVLNITITDTSTSTVTQFLTISITDINDNFPSFSLPSYSISFEEERQGKLKLDTLSASDPDANENGTISYSLQNTMSGLFSIDSSTGALYQDQSLDREIQSSYTLTAIASDQGNPSKQTQVTVVVMVTDINDNYPSFTPTQVDIDENVNVGTIVATLVGHDADIGTNGQVTFSYTQASTATSHFQLLSNGTIRVTQVPDYEVRTEFIFYIVAQDGGNPYLQSTGNITLRVTDLNDNCPMFTAPASKYNLSVLESTPVGTTLLNVTAVDLDQGAAGVVKYVMENIANIHQFNIDSFTGELILASSLDYEIKPYHEIGILAYDQGLPRNQVCRQTLLISVSNVNEFNPFFDTPLYIFSVEEGLPAVTVFGTVQAYDRDANSVLTFSLSSIQPAVAFSIVESTGQLRTLLELDFEAVPYYNATLTVTDEGGRSGTAIISVVVGNINDNNPSFALNTFTAEISEEAPNKTVIIAITATDADNHTNTPVSYSILGGNTGNVFGIDPWVGEVFVNGLLDYETTNSYALTIQATDTGSPNRTATTNVIITLINVNEYSPQFSETYSFNITEGLPPGTFVGQVNATDQDAGSYGNVQYSLNSLTSLFSIVGSTGVIRTLVAIDREATPTLPSLVVVASDSNKTMTTSLNITLIDVNDNPPSFLQNLFEFSVDLSSPIGTSIGSIIANDPDLAPMTSYSISNAPQGMPLAINSSTGILKVSMSLSEVNVPYNFTVIATDSHNTSFTSQASVHVYITSSNDHYPNFTKPVYSVSVAENLVPLQSIVTTTANDQDTGSNGLIRYSLVLNGSLTKNQFSINELSGAVSLTQALDYEQMTSHDVIVYARDSTPLHPRIATAHVLVTVTNVNDNVPMFTNFISSIILSYVPYVDLELFQLSATDPDGSSSLTFQLWTQTNKFVVDAETGTVRNIIVLNSTVTYSLEFRVSDGNHTISEILSLVIIAPSALAPSFPENSLSLPLSETVAIGKLITTFSALNSPTGYHLVCCGSALSVFSVNSQSGAFLLSEPLDFERTQEYQLVTEARKVTGNGIRYSDYLPVTVSVLNVNEFTPQFTVVTAPIKVNENIGGNSLIVQVSASDSDTGSYGTVSFQIINGNTNETFVIGSTNGAVTVAPGKVLDRESVSLYTLLIRATDGGGKYSTTMVTVVVQDENDSPPSFPGNYTRDMYEPGSIGNRILKVEATDPDSDSVLVYQLGNINAYLDNIDKGVSNKFSINSSTGVISLAGVVDFETADRYLFSVTVTDSQHTDTVHVTVNVLDINDNSPRFHDNSYQANLLELSSIGTSVLQVSASDVDSFRHAMVRYSLSINWPQNKFIIDPFGGTIRVQEPMTIYDLADSCMGPFSFTSTVYASDGLTNTSVSVTVTLKDVNKVTPVFIGSPYNVLVSETIPIGESLIPSLTISDGDCGVNGYYTTTFPNYYFQPRNLFNFDLVGGEYELTTKTNLPQGVYHFRLEAYNNRPTPREVHYYKAGYGHVTVWVLPNNTHAPVFNTFDSLSVYENSNLETVIGYVTATDIDLGVSGVINYSLNDSLLPFSINNSSGLLTVNGSLNYENMNTYSFYVIASDGGYPARSVSTLVNVQILDRDDNPPLFTSSLFIGSIRENSPINSTILTLNVTDADSIVNVMYSIENSTHGLPFRLHPSTGILSTSGTIDYETQNEYLLRISGSGLTNSAMTTSTWVRVLVESVNEFAPILPSFDEAIIVPNTLSKGGVVTTVVATDADGGKDGEIMYQFKPSTPYLEAYPNGTLILNLILSEIHTSSITKRQGSNSSDVIIQLTVVAMDAGTPPMNDTGTMIVVIPESVISSIPPSSSLTTEVIVIMSAVSGSLIIVILVILILITTIFSRSHHLKKGKLDLRPTRPTPQISEIPLEEEDSNGVELYQIRVTNSVTPTKAISNNRLNKSDTNDERGGRPSPHTRSTSDLASSIATDTLNLTQETSFPYTKGQIEAIYAANVDLLHDGSQASVHTFGSEGGGESDGDEFDNLYYTKYSELDVEGSLIGGEDDISSLGKADQNSLMSESSDGCREDEYHFSQSTNPWSSRRSINDLMGENSSALVYQFAHSQGGVPPYGVSTQGSSTSLLRGNRPHQPQYRGGSERDLPRQMYASSHRHRVPHPPSKYEYFAEPDTPPVPSSLHSRSTGGPRRYESSIMNYRNHPSIPRGLPPPPYYTQDPVQHSMTQGSSRGVENYYSLGFPEIPYEQQTLSTSSTSLSTNASHPYRGRGYP